MTYGFITLAVGKELYYKLAVNLLISYRQKAHCNAPFAIICDRENEYTALFDKVVILPVVTYSYMDKIEMLCHLPYDKNVFIDADCLIYNDISSLLNNCTKGVTCYGWDYSLDDKGKGWFEQENLGKLRERVKYKISTHGGIMFLCNDKITNSIYQDCKFILSNYSNFKFKIFEKPADEPIIALAMAINGCRPVNRSINYEVYGFYPTFKQCKMNIAKQQLSYSFDGIKWINNVKILHWQNHYTHTAKYMLEIDRLKYGNSIISFIRYPIHQFRQFTHRFIK